MGIRNRNIDANAKIALSKIDQAFGDRVFFEDFDDGDNILVEDTYGFDMVVTGAGTKTATHNELTSSAVVTAGSGAGVATVMLVSKPAWDDSKTPVFRTRMKFVVITNVEAQIGFADTGGYGAHDAPTGDHDLAYWEFDGTTSATWRLRTRNPGLAGALGDFIDVDSGITVVTNTWYNLEIKLVNGLVVGKVNDQEFRTASATATKNDNDWAAIARIEAQAQSTNYAYFDTWHITSER